MGTYVTSVKTSVSMLRDSLPLNCRECQIELTDENWRVSFKKKGFRLCSPCKRAKERAAYAANPESYKKVYTYRTPQQINEYNKKWREKMGCEKYNEYCREKQHIWRQKNREKANEASKLWYKNNKEKKLEYNKKYYTKDK